MDAIQIAEHEDARYRAEISAGNALGGGLLDAEPQMELLVLACANSAGQALDSARLRDQPWPLGARLVRVPCAGKIDPALVLQALGQGQDGVLVLACFPEACYSLHGNTWAGYRWEHLRRLLEEAGLESARLMVEHLAPAQHGLAMPLLESALERLRLLGPSPLTAESRVRELLGRFTVSVDHTYVIL
jgi:heterodisulfide reductase subunit A